MKKGIKIGVSVVAGLGIFSAGLFGKDAVKTLAGSDWISSAQNNAYSELLTTANQKQDEIVKNIDSDVSEKVNSAIGNTVDEQQAELQRLLDEYYKMKLDGLENTPEFQSLEQKIKDIQSSVLAAFKEKIDQEFANQIQPQQ